MTVSCVGGIWFSEEDQQMISLSLESWSSGCRRMKSIFFLECGVIADSNNLLLSPTTSAKDLCQSVSFSEKGVKLLFCTFFK